MVSGSPYVSLNWVVDSESNVEGSLTKTFRRWISKDVSFLTVFGWELRKEERGVLTSVDEALRVDKRNGQRQLRRQSAGDIDGKETAEGRFPQVPLRWGSHVAGVYPVWSFHGKLVQDDRYGVASTKRHSAAGVMTGHFGHGRRRENGG